ncbi:hypothetical protein ABMZ20_16530 [Pseudomonas aeruginosa]|uniref:hypothetical protein n=1 Tax=Pseudomonas aeruginosa TaxID=287 RepID=UPI0039BECE55
MNKALVEQAGGDERAAFEQWLEQHMSHHFSPELDLAKYEDSGEYRYNPAADYWKAWQARAALAQPSQSQYEASFEEWLANELEGEDGQPVPAAECDITLARRAFNHWPKLEQPAKVGGVRFSAGVSSRLVVEAAQRLYEFESTPEKEAERIERLQAFREQCFEPLGTEFSKVLSENLVELSSDAKPEQAGAERPEVVARVVHSNPVVLGQCGPLNANDELMTVAQHAASVARWAEMFNRVEQERDDAMARVAELEKELAMTRDAAVKGDAARHAAGGMEMEIQELKTKLAELEKQEPIGWWAQYCETPMRRMVHWGAKGPECTSEEFHPFYAAPFVKAQHRVPGKYDEVLLPFLKSMEHELHANAGKGDRPGWLQMDRKTALLEIYYHLGKLQKATKGNDTAGIVEYAADVANMSMMLVDVCGLLAAAPGNSAQHSVPEGLALIPVRETEAMHDAVMALLYKGVARTDTQKLLDAYIAAAPVCRLSRSALTEAQMRRLYENSTETENERLGFEAFARLIRRAEAVHQIAAAPAQGGE